MQRQRWWIAWWRDTWALLRQFRWSVGGFVLLILMGGAILRGWYPPMEGERLSWAEAFHAVFSMIFFESSLAYPAGGPLLLQLFFYAVPFVGLALVADGVLRFGTAFVHRRTRKEAWAVALASTYRDHVVVCGLGRLGYRVVQELLRAGEGVVAVEIDPQGEFVELAQGAGVPVLIGDARRREVLEQAGVPRAKSIVICTEQDLVNLAVALEARDLRAGIKVVMRMFDQELAEKVSRGFGIHTAFSTSALAAPTFAAAAMRLHMASSFHFGDQVLSVAELEVRERGGLVGLRVEDIEREWECSVIFYQEPDQTCAMHPKPETILQPGGRLVVFAAPVVLRRLEERNGR